MDRPPAEPRGGFPTTRHTLVDALGSGDAEARRRAFDSLVAVYWKPVYKYLRWKWQVSPEDSEDLTQGFFARAFERGFLDRFDPTRARFRTWLRTCLDSFAANQHKAAGRLKRGGGAVTLSLDFAAAEGELAQQVADHRQDPETFFHREWLRSVLARAVERLACECRQGGRAERFELLRRYDLEGEDGQPRPTYAEVGAQLGMSVTRVTNELATARRQLRSLVLEVLAETSGSVGEQQADARELLGGLGS